MGQRSSRSQQLSLLAERQEAAQRMHDMSNMSASVEGPTVVTRSMSGRIPKSPVESVESTSAEEEETSLTPEQLLAIYTCAVPCPSEGSCSICMCNLSEPSGFSDDDEGGTKIVELKLCSHAFHLVCIEQMINVSLSHIECPVCKTIHGVRIGNQPNGVMEVNETFETLPGYSGCGTIVITYYFANGVQGPEHPEPGKPYKAFAFPRQAYLPNDDKGKKVLKLLQLAWKRRLIFTIGTSVTTGMKNVITWNEIHHKTSFSNFSGHGYPDAAYLDNVIMELSLQGVTEDSIVNPA